LTSGFSCLPGCSYSSHCFLLIPQTSQQWSALGLSPWMTSFLCLHQVA
jgi:hypothetical protein